MTARVAMLDDVAAERLGLADDLETLTPEDWATPSLCAGWTVHDVVAHLTLSTRQSVPWTFWRTLRARGNLERAFADMARERAASVRSRGADRAAARHGARGPAPGARGGARPAQRPARPLPGPVDPAGTRAGPARRAGAAVPAPRVGGTVRRGGEALRGAAPARDGRATGRWGRARRSTAPRAPCSSRPTVAPPVWTGATARGSTRRDADSGEPGRRCGFPRVRCKQPGEHADRASPAPDPGAH